MAEWTANAVQTVNPGEAVTFTENPVRARRFIRHRDDTGNFLLSGQACRYCGCAPASVTYLCEFGANIAVPTGGTVGPISVALFLDGGTLPATTMIVTPAAVEEYGIVSRAANVDVWGGCCQTLTVRNTSDQPILVQNANILIERRVYNG